MWEWKMVIYLNIKPINNMSNNFHPMEQWTSTVQRSIQQKSIKRWVVEEINRWIHIEVREDHQTFWKTVFVIFRRNTVWEFYIPWESYMWVRDVNGLSLAVAEMMTQNRDNRINLICSDICRILWVQNHYIPEIRDVLIHRIMRVFSERIMASTKYWVSIFPKKESWRKMTPMEYLIYFRLNWLIKIPPSVVEAMDIRNKAMRSQVVIQKEVLEMKRRNNDYYSRHWNWMQKWKAYLDNFYRWKNES